MFEWLSQVFEQFSVLFAHESIVFEQLLMDETFQFDVGLGAIVHANSFFLGKVPFLRVIKLQVIQYSIQFGHGLCILFDILRRDSWIPHYTVFEASVSEAEQGHRFY